MCMFSMRVHGLAIFLCKQCSKVQPVAFLAIQAGRSWNTGSRVCYVPVQ